MAKLSNGNKRTRNEIQQAVHMTKPPRLEGKVHSAAMKSRERRKKTGYRK